MGDSCALCDDSAVIGNDPPVRGCNVRRSQGSEPTERVSLELRHAAETLYDSARLADADARRHERAGRLAMAANKRESARRARDAAHRAWSYAEHSLHDTPTVVANAEHSCPAAEQHRRRGAHRAVTDREQASRKRDLNATEREHGSPASASAVSARQSPSAVSSRRTRPSRGPRRESRCPSLRGRLTRRTRTGSRPLAGESPAPPRAPTPSFNHEWVTSSASTA